MKLIRAVFNKQNFPIFMAVALIIVGFAAGYTIANREDDQISSKTVGSTEKAYKDKLVKLGAKDASLTAQAVDALVLKDSKNEKEFKQSLYKNADELGVTFGEALGDQFKADFTKDWKVYLDQVFIYAKATKDKDEVSRQKSKAAIAEQSVAPLSRLFAASISGVNETTIRTGLEAYSSNITQSIDGLVKKDVSEKTAALQAADEQAKIFFGFLGDKITQQSSAKFKGE